MNVLLFVMSMLMMLVLITYGRLENFRNYAFVQVQFKEYMEKAERAYINEEAVKRYKNTPATKSEKTENQSREKNAASSKLSFNLFVDKKERDGNQSQLEIQIAITRNLMQYLYEDQPFYKEMEAKRSNFLNEIIIALIRESETLPQLKKTKEIATIDLKDPELNDVFTRMLRGAYEKPGPKEVKRPYKLNKGYYSLLDFITLDKNKLKLRVFLASKHLLVALYGSPQIVEDVLKTRYDLYRSVKDNVMDATSASTEFQQAFGNSQLPYVSPDLLDFGVSKTNPKGYE